MTSPGSAGSREPSAAIGDCLMLIGERQNSPVAAASPIIRTGLGKPLGGEGSLGEIFSTRWAVGPRVLPRAVIAAGFRSRGLRWVGGVLLGGGLGKVHPKSLTAGG